jgi:hypothetical protein
MPVGPLPPEANQLFAQALRQSMPNLKTQAQLTAFMIGFDAFRQYFDALCSGSPELEELTRGTLDRAIEMAKDATQLARKIEEIPPEMRGPASSSLVQPPVEFEEVDIQKKLLIELERITTLTELQGWYLSTREARDRVVSQPLRNVLLDRIRGKKEALGGTSDAPTSRPLEVG